MRAGVDAIAAKYDARPGPRASLPSPAGASVQGDGGERCEQPGGSVETPARRLGASRAPLGERLTLRHVAVLVLEAVRGRLVHHFNSARPCLPQTGDPTATPGAAGGAVTPGTTRRAERSRRRR